MEPHRIKAAPPQSRETGYIFKEETKMTKLETLTKTAQNLMNDLYQYAYILSGMDADEFLRKVVIEDWEYDPTELSEIGFDDILHWNDKES